MGENATAPPGRERRRQRCTPMQTMVGPETCRRMAQEIADAGVEANYGAGIIYALIAIYGALETVADKVEAVSGADAGEGFIIGLKRRG